MSQAIFLTKFPPSGSLPPVTEDTGGLCYCDPKTGELRGGWSCVGMVPQEKTCLVWVDTSHAMLTAMGKNTAYKLMQMCDASVTKPTAASVKTWLVAQGVTGTAALTGDGVEVAQKAHKVTPIEYLSARGTVREVVAIAEPVGDVLAVGGKG